MYVISGIWELLFVVPFFFMLFIDVVIGFDVIEEQSLFL